MLPGTQMSCVVVLRNVRFQDVNQGWKLVCDGAPEDVQVDVKLDVH